MRDALGEREDNLGGRGEDADGAGAMLTKDGGDVGHECIHSGKVEGGGGMGGLDDVGEWVPAALLVEDLALVGPYFPHLPIGVGGGVVGDLPAGNSSCAHGGLVVGGVCDIEGGEERSIEPVDGGAEGGLEGGPVCEGFYVRGEEEGEEVQGLGLDQRVLDVGGRWGGRGEEGGESGEDDVGWGICFEGCREPFEQTVSTLVLGSESWRWSTRSLRRYRQHRIERANKVSHLLRPRRDRRSPALRKVPKLVVHRNRRWALPRPRPPFQLVEHAPQSVCIDPQSAPFVLPDPLVRTQPRRRSRCAGVRGDVWGGEVVCEDEQVQVNGQPADRREEDGGRGGGGGFGWAGE